MSTEDVLERIEQLLQDHKWTTYRLANESGIPVSSLYNMLDRRTMPKLDNLYKICQAFQMSMSEFFAEDGAKVQATEGDREILKRYHRLTKPQKDRLLAYADGLAGEQKKSTS